MQQHASELGTILVDTKENLLRHAAALAHEVWDRRKSFTWALSGGSTPKEFYRHCVATGALSAELLEATTWTVSDERLVPLADVESNFGNAERLLLDPLGVPASRRLPWRTDVPAPESAAAYAQGWAQRFPGPHTFDLCFVGMGDDSHTLSLFPGSPLLAPDAAVAPFAAVEVPGKGWRLTLTAAGLAHCGHVVVLAPGASKAPALRRALHGPADVSKTPIQLVGRIRDRVTWLIDEAAAEGLRA